MSRSDDPRSDGRRLDDCHEVRAAEPGEAAGALAILQEAASWSATLGPAVWLPEEFELREQVAAVAAGELIGGFDEQGMAACMRLQQRDTLFWPDDPPGAALYVHKVAVSRRCAGVGWLSRLIDYADRRSREHGALAVRLDTLPHPRMIRLYTDLGFEPVDAEPRRFGDRHMIRLERRL